MHQHTEGTGQTYWLWARYSREQLFISSAGTLPSITIIIDNRCYGREAIGCWGTPKFFLNCKSMSLLMLSYTSNGAFRGGSIHYGHWTIGIRYRVMVCVVFPVDRPVHDPIHWPWKREMYKPSSSIIKPKFSLMLQNKGTPSHLNLPDSNSCSVFVAPWTVFSSDGPYFPPSNGKNIKKILWPHLISWDLDYIIHIQSPMLGNIRTDSRYNRDLWKNSPFVFCQQLRPRRTCMCQMAEI